MKKITCKRCDKLLLELKGKAEINCPRCKTRNKFDTKKNS